MHHHIEVPSTHLDASCDTLCRFLISVPRNHHDTYGTQAPKFIGEVVASFTTTELHTLDQSEMLKIQRHGWPFSCSSSSSAALAIDCRDHSSAIVVLGH